MNKFKIKGKTYTILEELPIGDDTIFKGRWKVINSKKEEFTLIQSIKQYSLYDHKNNKVVSTYSITFF